MGSVLKTRKEYFKKLVNEDMKEGDKWRKVSAGSAEE